MHSRLPLPGKRYLKEISSAVTITEQAHDFEPDEAVIVLEGCPEARLHRPPDIFEVQLLVIATSRVVVHATVFGPVPFAGKGSLCCRMAASMQTGGHFNKGRH